jgi:AraC-like DNA-binding protein
VDVVNVEYDLCYVTAGRVTYRSASLEIEAVLQPGDVFQRFPGIKHSTVPDISKEYGESFITIPPSLYSALVAVGTVNPRTPVLKPGLDTAIIDRFRDIFTRLRQAADLPDIIADMHRLVTTIYRLDRSSGSGDPYALSIEHACSLLDKFSDERSIPELLRDLPAGYERIRKVFTERLGVSPGEYRIRRKIDHAREMLLAHPEHLSVKEIACRLGYPDSASFAKQFKQKMGVSPEVFRREQMPPTQNGGADSYGHGQKVRASRSQYKVPCVQGRRDGDALVLYLDSCLKQ